MTNYEEKKMFNIREKNKILFYFSIYLFFYFYNALANPFASANILQIIFVFTFLAVSYFVIYTLRSSNYYKISTINSVQSSIFLILVLLIVFSPASLFGEYNFTIPRLIAILIIIVWFFITCNFAKRASISLFLPIVLFIPTFVQAILMSIPLTLKLYLVFPYLTEVLTLIGFIIYRSYFFKK